VWLSGKPLGSSTFCAFVTSRRFRSESFHSGRARLVPLRRSYEVGENCPCRVPTTALVYPTATEDLSGLAARWIASPFRRTSADTGTAAWASRQLGAEATVQLVSTGEVAAREWGSVGGADSGSVSRLLGIPIGRRALSGAIPWTSYRIARSEAAG
jgi:hypothetical protein